MLGLKDSEGSVQRARHGALWTDAAQGTEVAVGCGPTQGLVGLEHGWKLELAHAGP